MPSTHELLQDISDWNYNRDCNSKVHSSLCNVCITHIYVSSGPYKKQNVIEAKCPTKSDRFDFKCHQL
jgi:hypothetical protein